MPGLVRRGVSATELHERWCGDITYLPVGSGWIHLVTVIDLCWRRVVGWSMAAHVRTELVADAIEAAVAAGGGHVAGISFPSDRGPQ